MALLPSSSENVRVVSNVAALESTAQCEANNDRVPALKNAWAKPESASPPLPPLPPAPRYFCSPSDRSHPNNQNVKVNSGCQITLEDAQPGDFNIKLNSNWAPLPEYTDTLLFELVPADWKPPVYENMSFEMTPEQKLEQYQKLMVRIEKFASLRKIEKASGAPYAQDDWYLNYIKQIRTELKTKIGRSD